MPVASILNASPPPFPLLPWILLRPQLNSHTSIAVLLHPVAAQEGRVPLAAPEEEKRTPSKIDEVTAESEQRLTLRARSVAPCALDDMPWRTSSSEEEASRCRAAGPKTSYALFTFYFTVIFT